MVFTDTSFIYVSHELSENEKNLNNSDIDNTSCYYSKRVTPKSTSSTHNNVSPFQMVLEMGTGINLGNILSAPYEGNWASPLTEDYLDNVARLKFKHVRIPIRFDNQTTPFTSVTYTDGLGNYIGSSADYVVNTSYLDRIEQIIDWCISRNLIAIIDVHGDHWFWESFDSTSSYYATGNDRQARIDRFKAIWRDIAARFQNKPDSVLFEIMNEPFFSMSATEVIDINSQILSVIRNTNPTRCVIVTGGSLNSFQAPMQLSSTFLQSDNYLIATFHYYRPFPFTSSASQTYTDNNWGTFSDQNQVQTEFDQVYNWSVQNNIPIYLGEFGADNENGYNYFTQTYGLYGGPDIESRRLYHEFVANYARTKGFALAVWDAGEKSGKTVYLTTPKSWVKDVRNAVLGSNCLTNFLINNSDIECNYDYNWTIQTASASVAKLNNANIENSYLNTNTLEINVEASSGTFNNVIISNDVITSGFIPGNTYEVSCFSKALGNQQFKYRIKCDVGGTTTFLTSQPIQLTNDFSVYNYSFTIPLNTIDIQFQLLCGKDLGNYYFDEFSITDTTLSQDDTIVESDFIIFPNPFENYFEIHSNYKIDSLELFSIDGRKVTFSISDEKIYLSSLAKGVYLLKIISNSKIFFKKIIHK